MKSKSFQDIEHRYYLALLSIVLPAVYCLTSPHFAVLEDSGLFIMAAFFNGVAHPPGYPLYVLLGKLFTLIPAGSIAFRVHLLNILLGAATCCFVYGIIVRLVRDRVAAFSGALILGLSASFWFQSIIAEVYVMQAFFFAVLFFIALELDGDFSVRMLALFSFLFGLSMTNHYPLMILASGSFACILWSRRKELLRNWYVILFFFALGLLPYLHVLLARYYSNYSHYYAVHTFGELIQFISRHDYSSTDVADTATVLDSLRFFFFFIRRMTAEFAYIGFIMMIFGIHMAWRHVPRRIFLSLALGMASSSIFLLVFWHVEFTLLTRELYQYWQVVPLLCGSILIGVGLSRVGAVNRIPAMARRLAPLICATGCVLAVFASGLAENNIRDDSFGVDYAKITLESLPRNSVLILYADADIGPIAYMNQIERYRPDITVTTQTGSGYPERMYDWNADDRTMREETINYISAKLNSGRRVFTIAPLMYFGGQDDFPFTYVSHGIYSEIVDGTGFDVPPVIDDRLVEKGVSFLNRFDRGGYGQSWAYHRDDIVRKFIHLLHEAGRDHPLLKKHWVGKFLEAHDLVERDKNFEKADRLYKEIISDVSFLFVKERLGEHSLFIVNRLNWVNDSSMADAEKIRLVQESIDLSMPLVKKDPRCGNNLALLILRISRRMPVKINEAFFQQTFYRCAEFQGSF